MKIKLIKKNIMKKRIYLLLTIILVLGVSLASVYYMYVYRDSRENKLATGLVSVKYQDFGTINFTSDLPVIDDVGIENTPYEFTISNTSLVPINLSIDLELGDTNNIDLEAVRYALYINNAFVKKDYVHGDNLTLYEYEYMNVNETINCKLVFWVDYYYDKPGRIFNAKVIAKGENKDIFEGEYIKINYIEDLVDLSNEVNNGDTKTGVNYVLMRDLDFKNYNSYKDASDTTYGDINGNGVVETIKEELTNTCENCGGFIPIGNTNNQFRGTFNGRGYRIDNLYENNVNHGRTLGLFGVTVDSQISNVTVSGNIYVNVIADAGGIVGDTGNSLRINNCNNMVNITSSFPNYSIGGILGCSWSTGNVTIENSVNYGDIKNGNNTGGLVGLNSLTLTIKNSHNEGNITNSVGTHVGGLLGRDNATTNSTTIINSYNKGTITMNIETISSSKFLAGLGGKINGTVNIKDSHNEGEVIIPLSQAEYEVGNGGILGSVSGVTIIENTYNIGNITGGNRSGGILGLANTNSNVILNKTSNNGTIYSNMTSDSFKAICGGVVGYTWRSNTRIINSANFGNVTGYGSGGIIGVTNGNNQDVSKVINSYNIGTVSGNIFSSSIISSIQDRILSSYVNNVYNLGTITGISNPPGIAYVQSGIASKVTLANAYYLNTIASGVTGETSLNQYTTSMSEGDIKSQTFVNTLNNNLNSINLSSIDSSLASYTLSRWKLGSNGYPVFEWAE